MNLTIGAEAITLARIRMAWEAPVRVSISDALVPSLARSRDYLREVLEAHTPVYGVNTGFGQLAQVRIDDGQLGQLQQNLLASHAVGVGPDLPDPVVRLVLLLKLTALAQGYSGVRPVLVQRLADLLNAGICPCIPAKGSVGASGDLAPLAHMAGALIGTGEVRVDGRKMPAAMALRQAGLEPLQLGPKEGLALLNGTQVSTAIALAAVFRFERVLGAAIAAGALSTEAARGSDTPFDARIHRLRSHAGQGIVAGLLRELLAGSEIRGAHVDCDRVQDPYSIRCQPQVLGACLDVLRHVSGVLTTEANAVTDNPLVFADTRAILSGGNFHAEPVALAADYLALSIAEVGALAERRIALLIDPHFSHLPAFLVAEGGLNSGFMIAQVTAAALASENKSLAHPASVDSLPTSANQEDHVSMATFAARRLHEMLDNVATIVAIELLAAAQGIGFHRPRRSSLTLEAIIDTLRQVSPEYGEDRSLQGDVLAVAGLVEAGALPAIRERIIPAFQT